MTNQECNHDVPLSRGAGVAVHQSQDQGCTAPFPRLLFLFLDFTFSLFPHKVGENHECPTLRKQANERPADSTSMTG